MYIRRRRPESSAMRSDQQPEAGSTFRAHFAAAYDATNRRIWASGRKEWTPEDEDFCRRDLCGRLRKMPAPFPAVADTIEQSAGDVCR